MKKTTLVRALPILALTLAACGSQPVSLDLKPRSLDLTTRGATGTLAATVQDAKGETMADAAVTWTSSDPKIATVDANGLVTAVGTGTASIKAAAGESAVAEAMVLVQVPASIKFEPANTVLRGVGSVAEVVATVYDEKNESFVDAPLEWSIDNPQVATVEAGKITAVGEGNAKIQVKYADVSGTTMVIVMSPKPSSITVEPQTVVLRGGKDEQLYPTVIDDLGAKMDNPPIVWASQNPAVAVVDANGLVQGVRPGETVVTGTAGEVTAQISVRVR